MRRVFQPTRTSAAATRALSLLRDGARRRWRAWTSRRCSSARRWPSSAAQHYDQSDGNSGLWLGAALGELALPGPRQAHLRRRRADRQLRPLGRAAGRRVAPASRAGASCRSPASRSATPERLRRRPRVRAPAQRRRARRRRTTPPSRRWQRPVTRRSRCRRTAPPTSAGSSSSPSSPPRWPAGCSRSTRSTSPTCRRPRTTPSAVLDAGDAAGCPRRAGDALRALLDLREPAALRRDHGLRRSRRTSSTPRSTSCARAIRAAHAGGHDVRLRPALPALHGPAAQGRPADRALPAADPRRRPTTSISRTPATGSTTLKHAQAIGDLETLRDHGLPAERVRARRRPGWRRCGTLTQQDQGDAQMQIGFVGLGKMGGNMVAPHPRDSDYEVVAFDFERSRRAAAGDGAAGARLARGLVAEARGAAHGLADGPVGRPDRRRPSKSSASCSTRRHDHRRRQLASGPTKGAARRAAPSTGSTSSTSAPAAASGVSRSATA